MCEAMNRRGLLIRAGLVAAGVGGAVWLRDHVLWPAPSVDFADDRSTGWLPYAVPQAPTPTVRAVVGGREVNALIDSGAQYSVIDRALFDDLGLTRVFEMPLMAYGVGGAPQVGRGVTLEIEVGDARIRGLRTAILDLGPLAGPEGLSAPLILGQDVLSATLLDLDTQGRRARLGRRDTPEEPRLTPVEVGRGPRGMTTGVTVEGHEIEAVIDTGASTLLALSDSAAREAGLMDGRPQREGSSIVLGGMIGSIVVRARTLTFADALHRDVALPIFPDRPLPGFPRALLGMGAFDGRALRMDLGAGRLWVGREIDLTVG